jgi:hypothetical protein
MEGENGDFGGLAFRKFLILILLSNRMICELNLKDALQKKGLPGID